MVGSRDGLQRWRGEGRGFERVASAAGASGSLAGQFVSRLFEDHRGRIWIGTNDDGAALLDPTTGALHRFLPPARDPDGLSHFWVYGFAEPRPDEVWIATFGGGIDVVDGRSLRVAARLRHDPTLESTLPGDRIGAVLADASGLVWVGTWGQGIARHHPASRAFVALRHSPARPLGLTHPSAVRPLARRDGTIWVGTNGNGVDVFDAELRRIGGFRADPQVPGVLSDGSVTCLAEGVDGSVWVATLDGNLHRLRPGAVAFERLTPANGLPGGPIRALAFGPDGALWAGAAEGLARIDPASSSALRVPRAGAGPNPLAGAAVEALAFTADGTLWVGTDNGLGVVEPRSGATVRVVRRGKRRDQLPNNWVPDLLVTRSGQLWVGTQGGACVVEGWDGRELRCAPVAERLHRQAAPAEALIEDDAGWVWIGPTLRVDPRSWRSQQLGAADGVALRTFFIASRARTRDGRLLFGSPEGLLVVRPERLAPWTYAPPLVVTALQVGGVERPGAALLSELRLLPPRRDLRLDFAALDLTAPAANLYRYRLEGYDRGWIATDAAHRSLTYTNLRPGAYTLRVQGTNRAGRWSRHELRVPVAVLPAFYETGWFRGATAMVVAALAYAGYRVRLHRLERRGRELERLVGERTAALAVKNEELGAAYVRIEEASLTDPLTGLRNRRFLAQVIPGDLEMALRRRRDARGPDEAADLVFLLLDLDHFKSVNDSHGHAAGDAVLRQTAALLRGLFRASDHVVRWGGEEFLVVARFVDRREGAELAEKVRAGIAGHRFELPDGTALRRTCSLGFAAYPFDLELPQALSWEEVVHAADLALYAAKARGRDCWIGVEPGAGIGGAAAVQGLAVDVEQAARAGEVRLGSSRPAPPLEA